MLNTKAEWFIRIVVLYSVAMLLVEMQWSGSENSLQGHPFFLWSERIVALVFTAEFIIRYREAKDKKKYLLSPQAFIDLLSILPFYMGFFVADKGFLRMVRTLRLLRVLKFARYNTTVKHIADAFASVRREMQVLGILTAFCLLFGGAAILECEHYAQPDKFRTIGDGLWWATVPLTTIGYGDLCPVTDHGRAVASGVVFGGASIFAAFLGMIGAVFVDAARRIRIAARPNISDRALEALYKYCKHQNLPTDDASLSFAADLLILAAVQERTKEV